MQEKKINKLFQSKTMYVCQIDEADLSDDKLLAFSVKYKIAENLVTYLQKFAEIEEESNLMRTYIVRDNIDNELVGYFSLKAGMVSIDEKKGESKSSFNTHPGIEIANFAINNTYLKNHKHMKGCGKTIFIDFIMPIVDITASLIGVRDIYLFALPNKNLINLYESYGFSRLDKEDEELLHARLKPRYDAQCIFMFQKI